MNPIEIYRAMTRYNRWMNQKLLAACATLSDDERKRDLKAPFGSVHGTWNHLLLTDRIWLGRFVGTPFPFKTLADELYADFDELRQERALTDDAIDAFIATLSAEKMGEPLRYTRHIAPDSAQQLEFPLWVAVQQLFNHQTHHRGQITTLLEQLNVDCGVTDFPKMPGMPLAV